jgi:hypothetical protein
MFSQAGMWYLFIVVLHNWYLFFSRLIAATLRILTYFVYFFHFLSSYLTDLPLLSWPSVRIFSWSLGVVYMVVVCLVFKLLFSFYQWIGWSLLVLTSNETQSRRRSWLSWKEAMNSSKKISNAPHVLGNLEFGSLTLHQWKTSHNKLLREIQNLPDVFSDCDHCIWKASTCNDTSSWIRLFTHVSSFCMLVGEY